MSSRHRAREYVLKALYAYELGEQSREEVCESIIAHGGLDDTDFDFARDLFVKTVDRIREIDDYISSLATNWNLERLAVVDKNILRIAICEVKNIPDIPIKVAVNEAIELAKKYSTMESAAFVNGILDRVMREFEESEKEG